MKILANMFSIAIVTAVFAMPGSARAELTPADNSTFENTPIGVDPILDPDLCVTEPEICDDGESGGFEPQSVLGVGATAGGVIYTIEVSGKGTFHLTAFNAWKADWQKWAADCAAKGGTLTLSNPNVEGAFPFTKYRFYVTEKCVKN